MIVILCLFRFALPSYVVLPSGRAFHAKYQGRDLIFRCTVADATKIYSFGGSRLDWYTNDHKYTTISMHAEITLPDGKSRKSVVRNVKTRKGSEGDLTFTGARIDPQKYSVIEVAFESEDQILSDDDKIRSTREWATRALVWLVNSYRLVTRDVEVVWPRGDDVHHGFFLHATKYTFEPGKPAFHGDFSPSHFYELPRKVSLQLKLDRGDENLTALAPRLLAGVELEPHELFYLDAVELLNQGDNPDLAIVVAGTAFEVFLQRRLIANYSTHGATSLLAGKTQSEVDEAILRANVKGPLMQHLDDFTNGDIKSSVEFQSWRDNAYEPRNAILHRGFRGSTYTQAIAAFVSISDFIEAIRRLLP